MSLKDGRNVVIPKYMASCESYGEASIVMAGAPMDFTCSFRPGARFGPRKIREVSVGLEEYSVYSDRSLSDVRYFDCGDLDLPFGNVEKSLKIIGEAAREILDDGKFPLFMGGEHLVSVPVIREVSKVYNDLVVLHFDAHADLREGYMDCENSHASAIRRVMEFIPGRHIYQFGIRSGAGEEFEFAEKNTNMHRFDVAVPLGKVLPEIKGKPVYVTVDIDVVDPAFACGTGTPEPGGITSREMLQAVGLLRDVNIVGFDIVEVAPVYDASDRTAILAAEVIREIILNVGDKRKNT